MFVVRERPFVPDKKFMSTTAFYFTDFVKDTSFLIVLAYLLTRGRLLRLLFIKHLRLAESLLLGVLMGVIGLVVASLPDVGFQYPCQTLFAAFATLVGGLYVGLIVAGVTSLNTLASAPHHALETLAGVLFIAPLAAHLRRQSGIPARLVFGFLAGALAQLCHLLVHDALAGFQHTRLLPAAAWFSIPINGFGIALLLLVVSDAQVRADSERRLIEAQRQRTAAEHARALATEAQFAALRARIHPHFLFNALNSIAELCCIAPERAEAASLNLGQLMRCALETSAATTIPLRDELALTRAYAQIEQERVGERLHIVWQVNPSCETTLTVPFSVQLLVENAINHGLVPKPGTGTVTITIRRYARRTLFAVHDNGVGMPSEAHPLREPKDGQATHGLQILNQQLVLHYGGRARLRFFSRPAQGTLAVFALPHEPCHC